MRGQPLQILKASKMIRLPLLENVDLNPHWNDDIDNKLAMKHELLFADVENKLCHGAKKDLGSST